MNRPAHLAIVGGGAAGLTAAIFAAQTAGSGAGIVILDGAKSLGAKILVAGGGRCNVTHDVVEPVDFNGSPNVVKKVLAAFNADDAVKWFTSLGVELKREDTGKLFPVTDSARTVLSALLRRCEELGVTILTDHRVTSITAPTPAPSCSQPPGDGQLPAAEVKNSAEIKNRDGDRFFSSVKNRDGDCFFSSRTKTGTGTVLSRGASVPPVQGGRRGFEEMQMDPFRIQHAQGSLLARQVVISTGGQSLPKSGSDGFGWELARSLGHSVTPTHAALVPLVLDASMFHAQVSGISMEVELSTIVNGKRIDRRSGSLLWTHTGISGPVVMDASRHWVIASESGRQPILQCNLLYPDTFETVEKWLIGLTTQRPKAAVTTVLADRLPARLADAVAGHLGIQPGITCGQLPRDNRRALVHALTALPLKVRQHRGWNYAEVTAGGVPLSELDPRTMGSRKQPGLYLAGEILDCDGRIGGFNFQWAWATGYLAGTAAGGCCY